MRDYRAPLADIQFALALAGSADCGRQADGAASDGSPRAVLERAADYAEQVLVPLRQPCDAAAGRVERSPASTPQAWGEAFALGREVCGPSLGSPQRAGSHRTPKPLTAAVHEMCASANDAFALRFALANCAAQVLADAASMRQKKRYLPRIASGEWTAALAFAEHDARLDPAAVHCRAVVQADGSHRLFGQKYLVAFGEHEPSANIVYLTLARLFDANGGARGLSLFIVPKFVVDEDGRMLARNDVRCASIAQGLGHMGPVGALTFGADEGALGELVGEAGRASAIAAGVLSAAQLGAGVHGVAIGERAYQHALGFARDRSHPRGTGAARHELPLAEQPDIKRLLLNMRARIFAARLLVYEVAAWRDRVEHQRASVGGKTHLPSTHVLATVLAGWSSGLGSEVASLGMQVHGGLGAADDVRAARALRDALGMAVGAGGGAPDHALMVRELLHEQGASLRWLIDAISASAHALKAHGALIELGIRLDADAAALATALDAMLMRGRLNAETSLSVAAPFVDLLGVICGEWQMGRAALAAQAWLDQRENDGAYCTHIVGLARFYAVHIAPLARAHLQTVLAAEAASSAFADALP